MASSIDDIYLQHKTARLALTKKKIELGEAFYKKAEELRPAFFTALFVAQKNSLAALLKSIASAAGDGISFADWKKSLMQGDIIPLDEVERALAAGGRGYFQTVFRNALMGAYAAGRWHSQQELKDIFPYLIYDAVNDNRTRPTHHALDNKVARVDDPIWSRIYPPNGHNCRCVVRSLMEDEYQALVEQGEAKPFNGDETADAGWNHHGGESSAIKEATNTAAKKAEKKLKQTADEALKDWETGGGLPADFWADLPTGDEAERLGDEMARIVSTALAEVKAHPEGTTERTLAYMEAAQKIREAYLSRYTAKGGKEVSAFSTETLKLLKLMPKGKPKSLKAQALAEGIDSTPSGLIEFFTRSYFREFGEKVMRGGAEFAIRASGRRAFFSPYAAKPTINMGGDLKDEVDRGILGSTVAHEFMHAIQHYTHFDDPLIEFHRARVIESGQTRARDLSIHYERMQPYREFYFPPTKDYAIESGVHAYLYKAYTTTGAYTPYTSNFQELVTMLHQTLAYPMEYGAETSIAILSDEPLLRRYLGLVEWAEQKRKQIEATNGG